MMRPPIVSWRRTWGSTSTGRALDHLLRHGPGQVGRRRIVEVGLADDDEVGVTALQCQSASRLVIGIAPLVTGHAGGSGDGVEACQCAVVAVVVVAPTFVLPG
jgi:hypothetical protein